MDDPSGDRLVLAGSVGDAMTAQVVAARLRSVGIEAHLRGEGLGPYPMTVGRAAVTEIWVRSRDLADAREEIDSPDDRVPPDDSPPGGDDGPALGLVALFTLAVLAVSVVVYLMRVF
jgi:hypothetical protein